MKVIFKVVGGKEAVVYEDLTDITVAELKSTKELLVYEKGLPIEIFIENKGLPVKMHFEN